MEKSHLSRYVFSAFLTTCALAFAGCGSTSDDIDGADCTADVVVSGAIEAHVNRVHGCSSGREYHTANGEVLVNRQWLGVRMAGSSSIDAVDVALLGLLSEYGESFPANGSGVAAVVSVRDGETEWLTDEGQCEADFSSASCTTDQGESGRRYTVTRVTCQEAARAGGHGDVMIESLRLGSHCLP